MSKHNYEPKHKQKIIHIQRAPGHSFHALTEKKQKRNFIPLILLILLVCLGAWGVFSYISYRKNKNAQESYANGLRDLTTGNFNEASKSLEKSIEGGNNTTDAILKLGVSKYNQKDYTGAIDAYAKVLVKDPLNAMAENGLGNIYRDQKDYDRAQEQYEKTIQIDPSFAPAYANLSIMLLDLDRKKEALAVVQRGLEKIPGSMELKNIETLLIPEK